MRGPFSPGTFDNLPPPSQWGWEKGSLARGQTCRVVKAFTDANGTEHPVGEEWIFLGSTFSRFEDEMTICVRSASGQEWQIPLIWTAEKQAAVLDHWSDYVAYIQGARPADQRQTIMHTPAIGDWIHSYSPGVWQVYRILEGFNEFRYSLDARKKRSKRVIVFSRRLADAAWKPAFRAEACERSVVRALSPDVRRRLDDFLARNAGIRSAFEAYRPEPIPLIVNLAMNVPDGARLQAFGDTILARDLPDGVPLDRVLVLLTEAGLAQHLGKTPFNATLQLVCRDHEVRDHEFVLRDWRVLPF